jgi:hypothetical protein
MVNIVIASHNLDRKWGKEDGWSTRPPNSDSEFYLEEYHKAAREKEERDRAQFERCWWGEQEG